MHDTSFKSNPSLASNSNVILLRSDGFQRAKKLSTNSQPYYYTTVTFHIIYTWVVCYYCSSSTTALQRYIFDRRIILQVLIYMYIIYCTRRTGYIARDRRHYIYIHIIAIITRNTIRVSLRTRVDAIVYVIIIYHRTSIHILLLI